MKTIIISQTVSLLCKSQEEVNKLLEQGFVIKELQNGVKYLIKEN